MADLSNAISLGAPMDSSEVLDYVIPLTPLLETGEAVSSFTLTLDAISTAAGLEIIEDDGTYPDPMLVETNTAVQVWFRFAALAEGDEDFQLPGMKLPMVLEIVTNSSPPRTRQRTFYLTVKEQ